MRRDPPEGLAVISIALWQGPRPDKGTSQLRRSLVRTLTASRPARPDAVETSVTNSSFFRRDKRNFGDGAFYRKLSKAHHEKVAKFQFDLRSMTFRHIQEENEFIEKSGIHWPEGTEQEIDEFKARWFGYRPKGVKIQLELENQICRLEELLEYEKNKRKIERQARAGVPDTAYIYVIGRPCHPVKIGFSENVDTRLANLQTGQPEKLGIYFEHEVIPKWARKVEKGCHVRLAIHRQEGEWFDVTPEEAIEVVKAVATEMGATV